MKSLLYKLSHLFRKKATFKKVDDVRLDFAFEVGGIKYYEATDLNMLPYDRFLAATTAFDKLAIGIHEPDIRKALSMINELLSGTKVSVVEIVNLKRVYDSLITRMDSQYRPEELMWNVAAVVFMDETESPYSYDPVYGNKKIEFWKQHKDVTLFFSQVPLRRLVPFLPAIADNSLIFSETVKELAKIENDISANQFTNPYLLQKEALRKSQLKSSAKGTGRNSNQ